MSSLCNGEGEDGKILEEIQMDYNKAALEMHETHKGKVGIVSKVEVATRDDLSTAYTPDRKSVV